MLTLSKEIHSIQMYNFTRMTFGLPSKRTMFIIKEWTENIRPIVLATGKDGVEEAGNYRVDIDKLLQDVKSSDINYTQIWRTIVNGYPYKTPEEMGVNSKDEAYFVTKQAIYCVILNRNMNLYRGISEKGNRLVKAIERLKNIGLYGTQTPQETGLQVTKKGEVAEEKEHYSQTYMVTANVDIGSYTVNILNGNKSGIYSADKAGAMKPSFAAGETFKIMIPKTQANKKLDIDITINAKCKTYPIFYGETTVKGTQDYAITYSAYDDVSKNVKLNLDFNTGRIQVKKINEETSQPIENVTFELLDLDEQQLGIAITDKNGIANFEGLYPGDYKIREVKTGEQFILNSEILDITVEWNKTTTKTITNSYKKGGLKVIKKDAQTQKTIEGVSFDLLDVDGNIVQTGMTNENGEILFQNLVIGTYRLKENQPNEDYELIVDEIQVQIEHNQTTIQEVQNEKKRGNLDIYKIDKDNHKIALSDVTFELYSKELETVIGQYTTDEEGKIHIENLRIGEYELREVKTKEGYEIGENMNISIQAEETTSIIIENQKIPTPPKKEVKKLPKTGF